MATTTVTITGDASDLIGTDYNPSRTKVWLVANTDYIVDEDGAQIRLGASTQNVGADGTFSFANVIAATDLVENLQYTVWVDWPDIAGTSRTRKQAAFGPFDLSAESGTIDVSELVAVQALDPSYASAFMTQAQALLDAQIDLSGIDDSDSTVAGLVSNGLLGPLTQAALTASFDQGTSKTIYVSPSGNDSNSGLLSSKPKLTLAGALTAMGAGNNGRIVLGVGTISLGTGTSLSGYACSIIGQGDSTVLTVTGTQSGPALDFTGYVFPFAAGPGARRREIGGFHILGDNTADATKAKKGLRLPSNATGLWLHDISVSKTGGAPFDFGCLQLSECDRLTATVPIGANTNDVPLFMATGPCNAVRFTRLGFRSETGNGTLGVSGGLVFKDNGSEVPDNGAIISPWSEGIIVPTNGCVFAMKTNRYRIEDVQLADSTVTASGSSGTCVARFDAPSVSSRGGNEYLGYIHGNNDSGLTDFESGVLLNQSGNRVVGVKGYKGHNVVVGSGVGKSTVVLQGAYAGAASVGIVDNSGVATNTLIDYTLNVPAPASLTWYGGYAYGPSGVTGTRQFTSDGQITWTRIYVPNAIAITGIGVDITTPGASPQVLRVGLWKADSAVGDPATLVVDAGTIDGSLSGVQWATCSVTLAPGPHWIGVASQGGATGTKPTLRSLTNLTEQKISNAAATWAAQALSGTGQTGAFAASPSVGGTSTGNPILARLRT